ncbi:MAG: replicative DNA helicase [Candidatus Taylorbacteria bacterium RIFCSPLOWO2_01_FULL_45_15b]|uniref:Replicative DNA helicase n=1 Tax=Candidatus Taylorbacteria bacterium RIFCSPLOWO2_01_FULL_45_15b TaxID=1802319 RepID=A0A1G2NGL4_9BACT|nr:MAG: replicative DNA helicase [Candidatus Taylorbacteria bacterium RIFCSPLOWO2_01_FULL_45_15b]
MSRTSTAHLRVPPQNIDAEKALLGSIMLRPEVIHDVLDIVAAESFYSEQHRIVWRAIYELFGKNIPVDILSLSSRLSESSMLEKIGGSAYLGELVNFVPSAANAEFYATTVRNKHILRNLIAASENITELGYDEASDIEVILDRAEKKMFDITRFNFSRTYTELKDALGEAWERLDRLHKSKDEMRGVQTGFRDLDNKLAGLQKSDLIILAARPSMGKTSLALDIARQVAINHKVPVGIFSLEMSTQQLVDRMMAAEARVDAWKLRTGRLNMEEEFQMIRDSLDKLSKAPIFIDDQPGNNIMKMRSVARRLKSEHGLGLLVVDYLQLMVPIHSRNSDSMVQQVTEISRSLKNLARELDVPVLALSQLSRAVEQRGGKPRLSDLRDSGSIEQDADVVMFIHREDKQKDESEKTNIAEILIEKHRNGPTGKIDLYFDEKKATFLSVEKSDFAAFETPAVGGMGAF